MAVLKHTAFRSLERLHRLLPSDLKSLGELAQTREGGETIAKAFYRYMSEIAKPAAADLDDITRISLQLNQAGVWKAFKPGHLVNRAGRKIDAQVIDAFCRALGIPVPAKKPTGERKIERVILKYKSSSASKPGRKRAPKGHTTATKPGLTLVGGPRS